MRKLAEAAVVLALGISVLVSIAAQEGAMPGAGQDPNYYRFAANFYQQLDHGGDPRLDEKMRIYEPAFMISNALSDTWTGKLKLQVDVISAASNTVTPGAVAGEEGDDGGEGNELLYMKLEASAVHAFGPDLKVGGGLNFSSQRGYVSRGAFLVGTLDTPSRNDTFALRASGFYDTVTLDLFDGTNVGEDIRSTISFGPGWTHIVDGSTEAVFNWDVTLQDGFLATSNNPVTAAGLTVAEELPHSRIRHSVHARVRHLLLDRLAIEPGVGAYGDSWDARAFNLEFAAFWEAAEDAVIVEPMVRYHSQEEVNSFLSDASPAIPEYRTQDSDLGRFTSGTAGLRLVFPGTTKAGKGYEFDVGGEYTRRSDGISSFSVTFGAMWAY